MIDTEKVIKGLQGVFRCVSPVNHTCGDCPYQDNHVGCIRRVVSDALALLKAQEPRVLALDEIHSNMTVWLEDVDKADVILAITESEFCALHGLCMCFIASDNRRIAPLKREYGIHWRAWTSEPTDEQKKAVKWDG